MPSQNFPTDCPNGETCNDCRFTSGSSFSTCMYSPIVYDKTGAIVGGGSNTTTSHISCQTCGVSWISRQTDLDRALGKDKVWSKIEPRKDR